MIPTLCYLKDINEIGACRICVVEVEGTDKLVSSCNNEVAEGMVVNTMSPRVVASRRETMALILSRHKSECTTCTRNGNCMIQRNAAALNITNIPYPVEYDQQKNPADFPLVRDASKCISCMRCVSECSKVQNLNVWDLTRTGSNAHVGAAGCRDISEAACALCGQCITHCPCGALSERDDTQKYSTSSPTLSVSPSSRLRPPFEQPGANPYPFQRKKPRWAHGCRRTQTGLRLCL